MNNLNTFTFSKENMDQLNNLLENLYNSQKGYHECVDDIKNSTLKERFRHTASQRDVMIQEIKGLFINSEVQPTSSGTVAGAAHRVFVDLKSLITGKDEVSILKEVERGEKHLIETYKDTMSEIKEPLVLNLLHKQFEEIQADLIKWQEIHHSIKI